MRKLLILLSLITPIMGQEKPTDQLPAAPTSPTEKSAKANSSPDTHPEATALDQLFSTMGEAGFPAALARAEKAGIHPQVLLEARFLHLIDRRDTPGLAALAPEFTEKRDAFDPDNSEVFSVKEDWLAVVHYTQSLAALEKGDKAGFKKHITEAFWLSPKQAQAFAPHIDRLRLDEAMKSIKIDPTRTLKPQNGDRPTTLGELMKGRKATIFHFWSPMSQEVQVSLPDFELTTQSCEKENIAVISVLVGQYPTILEDAETVRKEDAKNATCSWLIDSNKNTLANHLRITNIPTMVIVSAKGNVLYNGHPSDEQFWRTIQKIAPKFKRPNNKKTTEQPPHVEHNHVHGDG